MPTITQRILLWDGRTLNLPQWAEEMKKKHLEKQNKQLFKALRRDRHSALLLKVQVTTPAPSFGAVRCFRLPTGCFFNLSVRRLADAGCSVP